MLSAPDFEKKQIIFAMINQGDKLSFKNDNIVIKDCNDKIKHQSTCYRLFALFVAGNITVTSGLLQRAEKFGFTIIFMNYSMRVYGVWSAATSGNVILRRKQYEYSKLDLAQFIVANKIDSQIAVLKSIRNKSNALKRAIATINLYRKRLPTVNIGLQDLLGIEGIASRIYFSNLYADFNWTTRRPRVKHDVINCLLDIGYTKLFNIIEALLNVYGFDLYQGVYHRQFYQRKSLVCDIVEPFRPLIDYRIRKAYNLGQIDKDDFDVRQGQYVLFGKKAKPYVTWLLEAILERKQDMFSYVQKYYRAFMKDKDACEFPIFNFEKG